MRRQLDEQHRERTRLLIFIGTLASRAGTIPALAHNRAARFWDHYARSFFCRLPVSPTGLYGFRKLRQLGNISRDPPFTTGVLN
jgi:hypothetical protein